MGEILYKHLGNTRDSRLFSAYLLTALMFASLAHAQLPGIHTSDRETAWQVTELYVNAQPYAGSILVGKSSPLTRNAPLKQGVHALYIVRLTPGEHYTLGLSYPDVSRRVSVKLFDQWPFSNQARHTELLTGPIVKTRSDKIEYRWNIGISPRSNSNYLYIVVSSADIGLAAKPLHHHIYITNPPIKSMNRIGKGITYLHGPSSFMLNPDKERPRHMLLVTNWQGVSSHNYFPQAEQPLQGELMRNGEFHEGLNHWQPFVEGGQEQYQDFFALEHGSLKLFDSRHRKRSGVKQIINADVTNASSLMLMADVKISRQSRAGTGPHGRDAPVAISVCYEDVRGMNHCGSSAWWQGFYMLDPTGSVKSGLPSQVRHGQKVLQNQWYRFATDLMQLSPKPKTIRSISLEGSGWPEREAWVREVHLLMHGTEHSK